MISSSKQEYYFLARDTVDLAEDFVVDLAEEDTVDAGLAVVLLLITIFLLTNLGAGDADLDGGSSADLAATSGLLPLDLMGSESAFSLLPGIFRIFSGRYLSRRSLYSKPYTIDTRRSTSFFIVFIFSCISLRDSRDKYTAKSSAPDIFLLLQDGFL
ncbi:unannotated protein [freshwater metagenome]|uniref:Unannotated protein n=1 Tax=freshwater metagenome TaxID=449393 RepID=A0A6J6DVJ2_9ZZZZ